MRKIIAAIVVLSIIFPVFASVDDSLMQQGNTAYQNEDYNLAIDCYQEIIQHGNEGAILYYNLGNAYFKAKQIAPALLWYERALRLDPSNEDIKHNIAYANLQITDKIEPLPQMFLTRWWNGLSQSMTATSWAIMAVVFGALFALLIAVMIISRQRWLSVTSIILAFISLIIVIFSLIFASKEAKRYTQQPEAIIMQLVVNAKGTPNETGASLFVIHEGLKVAVTDRVNDWVEIKLPSGEKGWVEESSLEII